MKGELTLLSKETGFFIRGLGKECSIAADYIFISQLVSQNESMEAGTPLSAVVLRLIVWR